MRRFLQAACVLLLFTILVSKANAQASWTFDCVLTEAPGYPFTSAGNSPLDSGFNYLESNSQGYTCKSSGSRTNMMAHGTSIWAEEGTYIVYWHIVGVGMPPMRTVTSTRTVTANNYAGNSVSPNGAAIGGGGTANIGLDTYGTIGPTTRGPFSATQTQTAIKDGDTTCASTAHSVASVSAFAQIFAAQCVFSWQ